MLNLNGRETGGGLVNFLENKRAEEAINNVIIDSLRKRDVEMCNT